MEFKNSLIWQYDPHGVINKLRLKVKLGPFIHHPRLDIERFANQSEWLENTLIEVEEEEDEHVEQEHGRKLHEILNKELECSKFLLTKEQFINIRNFLFFFTSIKKYSLVENV